MLPAVLYLLCFIISYLGNFFFKYKSPGAYIRRGDLTEGFFALRVGGGGGIFGVSYTWGAYFRTFTVTDRHNK